MAAKKSLHVPNIQSVLGVNGSAGYERMKAEGEQMRVGGGCLGVPGGGGSKGGEVRGGGSSLGLKIDKGVCIINCKITRVNFSFTSLTEDNPSH